MYSRTLLAGWADMDFNSHMRNTAFLDKSADVRVMYFADFGFPAQEFSRLRLGPVVEAVLESLSRRLEGTVGRAGRAQPRGGGEQQR